MKQLTIYQVKEAIHNYLWDVYCMDHKEINEFLAIVLDNIIFEIINTQVTVPSIVDAMIAWGNKKVERCAMNTSIIIRQQKN